ncbi:MAG: hypothetical protein O3A63_13370 [Proteobacteria bacterium]|nr:hypothetical protein [Pseudomonadota bacterium]
MGYRQLLKNYIRHLELVAGDNYIEGYAAEKILTPREISELKTIASEIFREAHLPDGSDKAANYNYRLRLLMNRYALRVEDVACLMNIDAQRVRFWRTSPGSNQYVQMSLHEFDTFDAALTRWLEKDPNRR